MIYTEYDCRNGEGNNIFINMEDAVTNEKDTKKALTAVLKEAYDICSKKSPFHPDEIGNYNDYKRLQSLVGKLPEFEAYRRATTVRQSISTSSCNDCNVLHYYVAERMKDE